MVAREMSVDFGAGPWLSVQVPAAPNNGGSRPRTLPPIQQRRTQLERIARDSLNIHHRLGKRLRHQLKQLELADGGTAVTLDGDEPKGRVRIGDGTPGSAGLPTREWLWMYREHNAGVARMLAEQRHRTRPWLPDAADIADDERLISEAMALLSPEELEAELRKRGPLPKEVEQP